MKHSQSKNYLDGHIFNHQTGCLDTIHNGKIVGSLPLMNPTPSKNKYLVKGSVVNSQLSYTSKPTPWVQNFGIPHKK